MAGEELTPEEVAAKLKEKDTLLEQALQQLQDANQTLKQQEDQYKQDIKNSQQQVQQKPIIIYPPSDKKIKKFWGNPFHHKDYQDVDEWLDEADINLLARKDRSVEEQVQYFVDSLSGTAQQEVKLRPKKEWESIDKIKKILTENFGDKRTLAMRQRDFYDYRQKAGQSLRNFSHELWKRFRSVVRLDDSLEGRCDTILCEQFVENVVDESLRRELRRQVRSFPKISFLQIREEAVLWTDEDNKEEKSPDASTSAKDKKSSAQTHAITETTGVDESSTGSILELMKAIKTLQVGQDVLNTEMKKRQGPARTRGVRKDYTDYTCYHCQEKGHIKYNCPKLRDTSSSPAPAGTAPAAPVEKSGNL